MSLIELLPSVFSLSRRDKLRLIQFLAEDLGKYEDSLSESKNGVRAENDSEIKEDERVQEAVRVLSLRNAVGRMEEEGLANDPGKVDIADSDQELLSQLELERLLPIRFPDESYEAAVALMKLLEAEKSAK
jgi:hypothetical protein